MDWPHYKERVTVVDVLESGACFEGVLDWINEHDGMIAGETSAFIDNDYILRAANGSGYGSGDGYGDGDGYGYGYGDGSGWEKTT